ncbi:hypothetical protein GCM10027425_06990 [Alteromonas gracilis]
MSALVDPTLCPDCRAVLDPAARCPRCGLALSGPAAAELWRTLVRADGLITDLRRADAETRRVSEEAAARTDAPVGAVAGGPAAQMGQPLPAGGPPFGHPLPPQGVSGSSVNTVLFVLGGIFVVIALGFFFAVTWPVLPFVIKALLMLGLTGGFGLGAVIAAGRGLRGTTETLWTITGALLLIDVAAAESAGLADLGDHGAAVAGVLLAVVSLGFVLLVRRAHDLRPVAGEIGVGVGVLLATLTEVALAPGADGIAEAVAAVLVAGLATLLLRAGLRVAAATSGIVAALCWLGLAGTGLLNGLTSASRADYWTGLEGWPLLVAAVLLALLTLLRPLPGVLRALAAGAALLVAGAFAMLPPRWDGAQLAVLAGVSVALAAPALLAPRLWGRVAARVALVPGALALALLVALPWTAVAWAFRFTRPFDGSPDAPIRLFTAPDGWSLAALALGVTLALLCCHRPLGLGGRTPLLLAPPLLALGALGWLADLGLPLILVVLLFVLAAASALPAALRLESAPLRVSSGALSGALTGAALTLAAQDELITAVLATALGAAGWALATSVRERGALAGPVAAAGALLTAYAVWAWCATLEATPTVTALLVAVTAGVVLLVAPRLLAGPSRAQLELGTVPIAAASLLLAPSSEAAAYVLTLLGAAVALWTILHRDRRHAAWISTALLVMAALIRLGTGAQAPELVSLPVAGLLLAGGILALRRDGTERSAPALGPGLTLAIVPSLLIGLGDPYSWHMLTAGLIAAIAFGIGAARRLQAPFAWGAVALLVIALRFTLPLLEYVFLNAIFVWLVFGAFGMLLLIAAILFEQTLRGLRRGWGYVSALR